jgi:hypothetical protein
VPLSDLRSQQQAHCGHELKLAARYATGAQESVQEIHGQWKYLIFTMLIFTYLA